MWDGDPGHPQRPGLPFKPVQDIYSQHLGSTLTLSWATSACHALAYCPPTVRLNDELVPAAEEAVLC